jgi:hypothetical protein
MEETTGKPASTFLLVSCLDYFYTLKMEAVYSSETSMSLNWTTRPHIPKGSTLFSHRYENFKSEVVSFG